MKHAAEFFAMAREREAIRRRRTAGQPWPWTDDKVFQDWSFCNVHREHDKTTMWFREHVRSKLDGWRAVEATLCFRFFNFIATGERVEDLLTAGWDREEAYRRLRPVRDVGEQLWTGAYRIRGANGVQKLESTLDSIEIARRTLPARAARWGGSLRGAWRDLCEMPFLGPLTSYEIVSDLRWTPVLNQAKDINLWASVGSGCANGLEWVATGNLGTHDSSPGDVPESQAIMRTLLAMSRDADYWPYTDLPWEMRECEHWACEVAKVVRARAGHSLKRRYHPPPTIRLQQRNLWAELV